MAVGALNFSNKRRVEGKKKKVFCVLEKDPDPGVRERERGRDGCKKKEMVDQFEIEREGERWFKFIFDFNTWKTLLLKFLSASED